MKKTNDSFAVAPKTFLESNQAVNTETGDIINITPEVKIVYIYMREQYCMHSKFNNDYNETWDRIMATVCPVGEQKRKQIAKTLTSLGLVEVVNKKSGKKVVKDTFELEGFVFTNNELEEFLTPQASAKRKSNKDKRLSKWKEERIAKGQWEDYSKKREESTPFVEKTPEPTYTPTCHDEFDPFDDFDDDFLPF